MQGIGSNGKSLDSVPPFRDQFGLRLGSRSGMLSRGFQENGCRGSGRIESATV
jgi:hypothetical protein